MRNLQFCRLHAGGAGSHIYPGRNGRDTRPDSDGGIHGDIRPDGSANASGRDSHSDGSASAGNRGAA